MVVTSQRDVPGFEFRLCGFSVWRLHAFSSILPHSKDVHGVRLFADSKLGVNMRLSACFSVLTLRQTEWVYLCVGAPVMNI